MKLILFVTFRNRSLDQAVYRLLAREKLPLMRLLTF